VNKLISMGLAAATLLVAPAAFPCGAPFGAGVNVDPHQDILLAHHGDVETYVFQPTFCGDAKNFGVILPVPSMLTAEPSLTSPFVFDAVDTASQPTVVERKECKSRGGFGDSGIGATPGGESDGTKVVASGTVGFLDWAQLEAKDEASFTSWLDTNGYPYDAQAKATFGYYVEKKWFFIAFKVAQDVPKGEAPCKSLGPIQLSFKTATPVVPSRMATAGGVSGGYGFSWRVFAITDPSEQVMLLGSDTATRKYNFSGVIPDEKLTRLAGLANKGDRLSKMTIWFDRAQTEDLKLTRAPAADYRETVYNTTYVDCDSNPPQDTNNPNGANNDLNVEGGPSCSTSHSRAPLLGIGFALAAVALLRRRR
jgi:hypothetical protein